MAEQRTPHRWLMLAVSMVGQIAGTIYVNGAPFLIPYLHLERGLSLVEAGTIAAAPMAGTMFTLVVWGLVVDRIGERAAMTAGLAIVTVGVLGASQSDSLLGLGLWFLVGGIGA